MNATNAFATATSSNAARDIRTPSDADKYDLILGDGSQISGQPQMIVKLPNPDDSKTLHIQIDHSLYPDAMLFAFSYGGKIGDAKISVSDENGNIVANTTLITVGKANSTNYEPKRFTYIKNTEGEVKDYAVTVSTNSGDAICAINIGTEETFVENFGGEKNITSVSKNVAGNFGTGGFAGKVALLNEDGEWFQYTADGYTYITGSITNENSLAFRVYDEETGECIAQTAADDRVIQRHSSTLYTGHVQLGLDLDAGHSYRINFYSTSNVQAKDFNDNYGISIGLPKISMDGVKIKGNSTYSLPAYKQKTFRFTVSNQLRSARLAKGADVEFITNDISDNVNITYCKITAPNGRTFMGQYGTYHHRKDVDFENYLSSIDNVPLNGTWTVTIKSSQSLSGLRFKILGNYYHIMGNYGN